MTTSSWWATRGPVGLARDGLGIKRPCFKRPKFLCPSPTFFWAFAARSDRPGLFWLL